MLVRLMSGHREADRLTRRRVTLTVAGKETEVFQEPSKAPQEINPGGISDQEIEPLEGS